jgi:hypothetical protein
LRHTIESCFLPLQCRCIVSSDRELTVEVLEPDTGANVIVGGVSIESLNSSRAIATLVAEVRAELSAGAVKAIRRA